MKLVGVLEGFKSALEYDVITVSLWGSELEAAQSARGLLSFRFFESMCQAVTIFQAFGIFSSFSKVYKKHSQATKNRFGLAGFASGYLSSTSFSV